MRKPMIAGNWKLHKTKDEARALVAELKKELAGLDSVITSYSIHYTKLYERQLRSSSVTSLVATPRSVATPSFPVELVTVNPTVAAASWVTGNVRTENSPTVNSPPLSNSCTCTGRWLSASEAATAWWR